jgi:hypothetical protein
MPGMELDPESEKILKDAIQSINNLDKASIQEMKAFAKPPASVKDVMAMVMVLKGKKENWAECQKEMANPPLFL